MRFERGRLLCLTSEGEKSLLIIGVAVVQPTATEESFADVNQLGIDTEMRFTEEGIERKNSTSYHSHERPDDTEQEDAKESAGKLLAVLQFVKPDIPTSRPKQREAQAARTRIRRK